MRTFVLLVLVCFLCACQLEVNTDKSGTQTAVATETLDDCDDWSRFCTDLRGQVYYTVIELQDAVAINGNLHFVWNPSNFQMFLVGEGHAYGSDVDDDGQFDFYNVQPGSYQLIGRITPPHGTDVFFDLDDFKHEHPYRIGFSIRDIIIRERDKVSLPLIHIKKVPLTEDDL